MKDIINYSISEYEGIKVIDLTGNLTSATVYSLENYIKDILNSESIMINMVNVKLITSAGLNLLIDISFYAKEGGRRVIYLLPSIDLIKLTEIMDIFSYLIFAESMEEGVIKIRHFT
jgi:anti-anti-sigma factor